MNYPPKPVLNRRVEYGLEDLKGCAAKIQQRILAQQQAGIAPDCIEHLAKIQSLIQQLQHPQCQLASYLSRDLLPEEVQTIEWALRL